MTISEKILSQFSTDEPIFIEDIAAIFSDKSRPWVDKVLKKMVDSQELKRFSNGVYYIPRKTIFGESTLDSDKIISKKYIEYGDTVYGYVAGTTLLNSLGLTTQVPNIITVITNNEKSRGRKVMIGRQEMYLMKSPTEITKENRAVLQLLEAVKLLNPDDLDETENKNLEKYIMQNSITLSDISKYCVYFPDSVSKKLLRGNLIGNV